MFASIALVPMIFGIPLQLGVEVDIGASCKYKPPWGARRGLTARVYRPNESPSPITLLGGAVTSPGYLFAHTLGE